MIVTIVKNCMIIIICCQSKFKLATSRFSDKTPTTKEAYLYRDLFEQFYPNCSSLIMNRELPEWAKPSNESSDSHATGIVL